MTHAESLIIPVLVRCRFTPGSFAKRFARDMNERCGCGGTEAYTLSLKQRQTLWEIAYKFRVQIRNRVGSIAEKCIELHRKAFWEGADLKEPEQRQMELALSLAPNDWTTRKVYADWLEERGQDVLAAGQRWQAEYQQHAAIHGYGVRLNESGPKWPGMWHWGWAHLPDTAPKEVCDHLPVINTRIGAEMQLADALAKEGV